MSRSMVSTWWVLACTGCLPGLVDPVPLLQLPGPQSVGLEPDTPTVVPIDVTNIGTAEASFRVEAAGDVALTPVPLRLAPGATLQLRPTVTAQGYASVQGEVHVWLRGELLSVSIAGQVPDDVDGDGHAAAVRGGDDCDDLDAERHPGRAEVCNGLDEDCDDLIDEGLDTSPYWPDADGDGFGDGTQPSVMACEAPAGHVDNAEDCHDGDASVAPSQAEIWYDGTDQDCDGASDYDQDGDGADALEHGGDDCDDLDADSYPQADERLDGQDNDCDGARDEDFVSTGDLVLTEIFLQPQTGSPEGAQWIELVNASFHHADVSLVELQIDGLSRPLTDVTTVLAPDETWLVCRSDDVLANGGLTTCDSLHEGLVQEASEFTLLGPSSLVDTVSTTDWTWEPGRSFELGGTHIDAAANDLLSSWCLAVSLFGDLAGDRGTPGLIQPPCR